MQDLITIKRRSITDKDFKDATRKKTTYATLSNITVETTFVDGYKFIGDFYGLLQVMGIPYEAWFITLELNGLSNPNDYDGKSNEIRIYTEDSLTKILE